MAKQKKKNPAQADSRFSVAVSNFVPGGGPKEISEHDIVSDVLSALELTPPVDGDAPWSKLAKGDITPWDAALAIMSFGRFRTDGVEITKTAAMNCGSLNELGDLVFGWYEDHGYTVD